MSGTWCPARSASASLALLCLVVAGLVGCASSAPPATLLALPALAPQPAGAAPASAPNQPLLAVRRVALPEYLLARPVRYRDDASTLAAWPNTYWAERIEVGVSRELVSALRAQLPGWTLCDASCPDAQPSLALLIDLAPLDYVRRTQRLQGHARVTVASTGGSARTLQTLELSFEVAAGADTPQAHAQALSEMLQSLAQQVAPAVQALRP
jgi:uncharacterized lipoprotein YmbA